MFRILSRVRDGLQRHVRPSSVFQRHVRPSSVFQSVLSPVGDGLQSHVRPSSVFHESSFVESRLLSCTSIPCSGIMGNHEKEKCDFCTCASCFREAYMQPSPAFSLANEELAPKDTSLGMEKGLHLPFIFTCSRCGQNRVVFACSGEYKSYHFQCALRDSIRQLNLEKLILLCPEDIYRREMVPPSLGSLPAKISLQRKVHMDLCNPFELPAPGLFGRERFYVLRISYLEGYGFIIHGLWVGEMCNGKLITVSNFVERIITEERLFQAIELQIHMLPPDVIDFLQRHWFDRNCPEEYPMRKYMVFWIRQILKHATEGDTILVEDNFRTLVQLAKPVMECLEKIVKKMNLKDFHDRENFRAGISMDFGKEISINFKKSEKQPISSPVPNELTFLFTKEGEKVDMPRLSRESGQFHF